MPGSSIEDWVAICMTNAERLAPNFQLACCFVMSSEVAPSLDLISRDSSTEPVLSEVEGLGMTLGR
jgi:hypothetical protein